MLISTINFKNTRERVIKLIDAYNKKVNAIKFAILIKVIIFDDLQLEHILN